MTNANYPQTCPKCQEPAYHGASDVKCSNVLCSLAEHPVSTQELDVILAKATKADLSKLTPKQQQVLQDVARARGVPGCFPKGDLRVLGGRIPRRPLPELLGIKSITMPMAFWHKRRTILTNPCGEVELSKPEPVVLTIQHRPQTEAIVYTTHMDGSVTSRIAKLPPYRVAGPFAAKLPDIDQDMPLDPDLTPDDLLEEIKRLTAERMERSFVGQPDGDPEEKPEPKKVTGAKARVSIDGKEIGVLKDYSYGLDEPIVIEASGWRVVEKAPREPCPRHYTGDQSLSCTCKGKDISFSHRWDKTLGQWVDVTQDEVQKLQQKERLLGGK